MKLGQENLDALISKYGDIFTITVKNPTPGEEDLYCYLRQPTRDEYFAFFAFSTSNPMKGLELILNSCWVEGDDEIMENDKAFFGALAKSGDLIEVFEADLKKN
jgi:hypothetical protein